MIPRPQTTKELAKRIDPQYIRRDSFLRRFRGMLSFLLVVGAIAWWVFSARGKRETMLNPGHVSAAHAMFENNCAACHDNDGKGGFRAAVSDSACLKCHEAAAHHPSQLLAAGDHAHDALAMAVVDSGGHMRSANCAACHVEHRGRRALGAVDDSTCTRCHENLNAAISPKWPHTVAARVTKFDALGDHPYFGAEWVTSGNALPSPPASIDPAILVDPTHLKFNHSVHMTDPANPAGGAAMNCTICHVNRNRRPAGTEKFTEPWSVGEGRYMRPISYARDCESCHKLSLPGGATLPHARMELVLGSLTRLEHFYHDWLARQTDEQRKTILGDRDAEQWVKESVASLRNSAGEWAGGLTKDKKVMPGASELEDAVVNGFALDAGSDKTAADAGADIRVMSAYVAYANANANRCAKCHEVKEIHDATLAKPPAVATDPPAAPAANAPLTATTEPAAVPTTAPAADPAAVPAPPAAPAPVADPAAVPAPPAGPAPAADPAAVPAPVASTRVVHAPVLVTIPTGIPEYPRRWFRNSTFDHQSHQNITCTDCHVRAKTSTQTSDVLSPNLTWTLPSGATASCAQCHHPVESGDRGAAANCVTCHVFHDRSIPTAPAHPEGMMDAIAAEQRK